MSLEHIVIDDFHFGIEKETDPCNALPHVVLYKINHPGDGTSNKVELLKFIDKSRMDLRTDLRTISSLLDKLSQIL